jgi:hypothetical protein
MSATGSSLGQLMERNVSEVFGERDPSRRRAAIAELYADDCAMYDTEVESVGQAAVSVRVDGVLGESPPGFAFTLVAAAEVITTSAACAGRWAPPEAGRTQHGGRCPLRERKDPDALHIRRGAAHRRPKLKAPSTASHPPAQHPDARVETSAAPAGSGGFPLLV